MGKIKKKYINKIKYIYYIAFTKFLSTKKNKKHNILIKIKSLTLTQLKIK